MINRLKQSMLFIFMISFSCIAMAKNQIDNIKLTHPIFGIIIPMPEESSYIKKILSHQKNISIAGTKYIVGKIHDKNVVFVQSGLGKVNSAAITSRLIRDFQPDVILLSGSSGNINPAIKKGDVVIGKNVMDADFGVLTAKGIQFQYSKYLQSPQTNLALPLQFNLENHLINLFAHLNNKQLPHLILGKIATSDALPNTESQVKLLQENSVDIIEMEGSAMMQTCWIFNTECVVVRGVSNNVDEAITLKDIQLAADNAAKILVEVIAKNKV